MENVHLMVRNKDARMRLQKNPTSEIIIWKASPAFLNHLFIQFVFHNELQKLQFSCICHQVNSILC